LSKVHILQVHHLYYDLSLNPWEYPDTAVITLCNWCHSELHKISSIPVYKKVNNQRFEVEVSWCDECKGSGNKPQFWYKDNGICYGCRGRGFSEVKYGQS